MVSQALAWARLGVLLSFQDVNSLVEAATRSSTNTLRYQNARPHIAMQRLRWKRTPAVTYIFVAHTCLCTPCRLSGARLATPHFLDGSTTNNTSHLTTPHKHGLEADPAEREREMPTCRAHTAMTTHTHVHAYYDVKAAAR